MNRARSQQIKSLSRPLALRAELRVESVLVLVILISVLLLMQPSGVN